LLLLIACAFALVVSAAARAPAALAAPQPLSIAIDGNRFVNGEGKTVRLLGVNRPSMEYACIQGWGLANGDPATSGPLGQLGGADAQAIAAWDPTAVRIGLNEDCWLGAGGYPAGPGLTVQGYSAAVEDYVGALHRVGLYAILDLHWSAPGDIAADGQRQLPDAHALDFWSSVAAAFADDPAVVFDAFNEPFSTETFPVSWDCWRDGGCPVADAVDGSTPVLGQSYTAVGMQAVVDAIRGAGARQPILLGGLDYANDLSGWLAHEPLDPLGQLAASFHAYQGKACEPESCWDGTIASVAAQVPVVTGEFDEDCPAGGSSSGSGGSLDDGFDERYMDWADAHGISYLAWGWFPLSGCGLYLVSDWGGTPAAPNGVAVHDHLVALWNAAHGGGDNPQPAGDGAAPTAPPPAADQPAPPATRPPSSKPPAPVRRTTRRSLRLRIATLHVSGRRLTVTGSLDRRFRGRLVAGVRTRGRAAHGRPAPSRLVRATVRVAPAGRFRLVFTRPRAAARVVRVRVSFGGSRAWRPAAALRRA